MNTTYIQQQSPPSQVYVIQTNSNYPPQTYPATIVNSTPSYPTVNNNTYNLQNNERRDWRESLFGCGNNIIPSCCMSFFCQCLILGQLSQISGFAPFPIICCGYVFIYILFIILGAYVYGVQALIWLCVALIIWAIRKKFRTNQNIAGNDCEDCVTSFFCQSCAISQMAREFYQYREVCDEFVCSEDGKPSYFNNGNNQGNTPTWQQPPQPRPMYFSQSPSHYPSQYVAYAAPPQTTTAQYVQPPAQPTVVKGGWEGNIGGASAYPYTPSNQPGIVGTVTPTVVSVHSSSSTSPHASAAPAPPRAQQYYEEEGP